MKNLLIVAIPSNYDGNDFQSVLMFEVHAHSQKKSVYPTIGIRVVLGSVHNVKNLGRYRRTTDITMSHYTKNLSSSSKI